MNVLFYAVWFSWFLSEFLVNRLFRSKLKDSKDLDKGSVRLIWITIMTSMVVGVFCSNRFHFPIYQYESITYIGLGLILTGMIIRFMAIRTLGASFTVDLAVKEEQKLIYDRSVQIHPPSLLFGFTAFICRIQPDVEQLAEYGSDPDSGNKCNYIQN